jgi:hypothetical protein
MCVCVRVCVCVCVRTCVCACLRTANYILAAAELLIEEEVQAKGL